MAYELDFARLAVLVDRKQGSRSLQETADEIGDISASTLSRVLGGRINDITMSTVLVICDWLEIDPRDLFITPETLRPSTSASATAEQIRQSTYLSPKTATLLAELVLTAYRIDCQYQTE